MLARKFWAIETCPAGDANGTIERLAAGTSPVRTTTAARGDVNSSRRTEIQIRPGKECVLKVPGPQETSGLET